MSAPLGIGVVGLGYAGATHLEAWNALAAAGLPCRVVAVADRRRERLAGGIAPEGNLPRPARAAPAFDPRSVRATTYERELLADPEVAIVDVCTTTESHVALAAAALEAGKHVLVEKPVALSAHELEPLAALAARARRLCMPAHCMRFWPEWAWLRARIAERTFGAVRGATFARLASRPAWSPFYGDPARSGGALCDLHVHDVDYARWCFGDPDEVVAAGGIDHVTALFRYPKGPAHVALEGGWDHARGFPFRMRYTVAFERATADYDLARDPPLVVARGGRAEPVVLPRASAYELETRALLEAALAGAASAPVTLEDAAAALRVIEAERESLASGRAVRVARG